MIPRQTVKDREIGQAAELRTLKPTGHTFRVLTFRAHTRMPNDQNLGIKLEEEKLCNTLCYQLGHAGIYLAALSRCNTHPKKSGSVHSEQVTELCWQSSGKQQSMGQKRGHLRKLKLGLFKKYR